MNKRILTLVVEFDKDECPNWIWESHMSLSLINSVIVKAIAEGNVLKENFETCEVCKNEFAVCVCMGD